VVATRRDVLGRFLGRHASGNHPKSGPFIDELVDKLKAAAQETIALHADSVDFAALQFEVAEEIEHLRLWEQHIDEIERRVELIYQRVHPTNALRLINRIYRVLKTGEPYVLRDQQGFAIAVQEGKRIVTAEFSVPFEVRQSRRRQLMPQST
jgi:hypothetical protein